MSAALPLNTAPAKIAVIGGGIAGLVAAWLLSARHRVTLFERQAQPGFVASSVTVPGPDGPTRVDVPLRVFYPGYYPGLTRLYAELGVASEAVSYATTFMDAQGDSYFRWRNLRLGDWSLPYVLPHDLAGAPGWRTAFDALSFRRLGRRAVAQGSLKGLSLADFLAQHAFSPGFVNGLLLPTWATVATCTHADALAYPAQQVVDYLLAGLASQSVRRASKGADEVAAKLLAGIEKLVCKAQVQAVRGTAQGVQVLGGDASAQDFDHVVLATQANQALALWADAVDAERQTLAAFEYRALEVLVHRDRRFMPTRSADWSAVNARVCASKDRPQSTIWINAVQPALRHAPAVFQTVQPHFSPSPELLLSRARFERPVVNAGTQAALERLRSLHQTPGRRVWLCGSYAQPGVPLLESAVQSAYALVAALSGVASQPLSEPSPSGLAALNST